VIEIFSTPEGLTLSYERRGSGPLLVCHPGGPGGSAAEFLDFAGLDDTFELLLLSPRGSHGSDPADDYALRSYVADVEALREHLGLERLNLLGFSHGGCVATAYAAAHPSRVERLLLVDTLAVWEADAEAAMGQAIERRQDEPWFAEAARAIEEEQAGEFASVDELIANLRRQIPLYFHSWEGHEKVGRVLAEDFAHAEPLRQFNAVEFPTLDLRGDLRMVEAPTLVVVGDDDFICGPACADAIVRELPSARLVTIPASGHFVYIEQPEAFRAGLTEFLL
jgi:pimeloyl-ACP methyl ester carboxylesterase